MPWLLKENTSDKVMKEMTKQALVMCVCVLIT